MGKVKKTETDEKKIFSENTEDVAMNEKPKDKLDSNSEILTSLLSKMSLNEQQKEEVKTLLNDELETSVNSIKSDFVKEGQEIKRDFLTIFGLFASFVTFLSIEVQVFKNRDNILELLGITSISLSFVMFFALVINDISKDKSEWKNFKKPTYIINIGFAVLGVLALYIGGLLSNNEIKNLQEQNKKDKIKMEKMEKQLKIINEKVEKKNK
jgi:hypothetical protein